MSNETKALRLPPGEMRGTAAELGRLSGDAEQAQGRLQESWRRMDGGWEWYAAEDINGYYGRAMDRLDRMAGVLDEMGQALCKTADLIEAADLAAAGLFAELDSDWASLPAAPGSYPSALVGTPPDPPFGGLEVDAAQYGPVEGPLFVRGPEDSNDVAPSDITQGRVGDCYFMSPLAAIALNNPEAIRRMIRDNGDGTYSVTFYKQRNPLAVWEPEFTPVEVRVTNDLPLMNGSPVFARPQDMDGQKPEVWAMMVEKAYAQYKGGYEKIHYGYSDRAMQELTGLPSQSFSPGAVTVEGLANRLEQGHAVTATSLIDYKIGNPDHPLWDIPDATNTHPLYQNGALVASHEYYIVGVDKAAGTVTLRNPHGWHWGETTLPLADFQSAFSQVTVNPIEAP